MKQDARTSELSRQFVPRSGSEVARGRRLWRSDVTTALAFITLLPTGGCSKPKEDGTRSAAPPSAASAPVASPQGLTPALEQLIDAAKSPLSPEEKRSRLKKVLETFPQQHSKQREQLILDAVARGALDPPKWTTITSNYKGRRAQIQVTTDALTILGVRFDMTAEGAQKIADQLHAVLPTPRILQLVWEQAAVRLEPCTLPADAQMASTARMIEHSSCVDQRISGRVGLVANEGKHWVLTNSIAGKLNQAANYGWFVKGRRPIQTVGTRHDTAHTDYSQIVRLVRPTVVVEGRDIDIRDVGRSSELWGLVSDEGPLLVWRATKTQAPEVSSESASPEVPTPAPGDPTSVRVALKPVGMPVSPAQLPATTHALRRNTFARRIASSLRMRPGDIPEEAYMSAGAAACGGRDLFFDLMSEIPVNLSELQRDQRDLERGLHCGRVMAPRIRAGITLYEAEYTQGQAPASLALLAVADEAIRDRLLYPQLAPTPSGVHRAYCNDDAGGPRSVCENGAEARLLLAVDGGFVAAFARDVPSLLERLPQSVPPPANLVELSSFFLAPSDAEEVAVAEGGSCGFAMDFALVELSPDETNRQRVLDAINDNAELCGTESAGSVMAPHRRLMFLAKNETGAKVLAQALRQRALQVQYEVGVAQPRGEHQQAFTQAMRTATARAARAAQIELSGRRVSVSVTVAPVEAEKLAMAKLLDARKERGKWAAEIVGELARGDLPTEAQLARFRSPGE